MIGMRVAFAALAAIAAAVVGIDPAHADRVPVRPGDTIVLGSKTCTLGYVYRWGGATMGLTAGHCAVSPSTRIVDTDAKVTGNFVGASFTDRMRDWQLIDFGDVPWSQRIQGTPYFMTGLAAPRAGQGVCHYGAGSQSVSCGTTLAVEGPSIAVNTSGTPGDSGGPCFAFKSSDEVTAIGLWHGHDNTNPSLGYCVSVDAALTAFGENSDRT